MSGYQIINKRAGVFNRPTRAAYTIIVAPKSEPYVYVLGSKTPTIEIDRVELDKLLKICKE